MKSLARSFAVALLMASLGCSAILAAEPGAAVSPPAITSATTSSPDFESLRVKGLNIALPGPQDTIDPDFKGIRSSLASLGIGYIGWSSNSFYNNMLSGERTTFGQQAYNGQKPTFFTNNVMLVTFDLSRYGIPDGQIVAWRRLQFRHLGARRAERAEPRDAQLLSDLSEQAGRAEGWISGQCS